MNTKTLIVAVAAMCCAAPQGEASAPISQEDFINVSASTVNGVVSVKSYAAIRQQNRRQYNPFYDDPLFQYFFGNPQPQQPQPRQRMDGDEPQQQQRQIGLGSGVIISSDGYIVTNNHVVEGADRLEVVLNDNRNYAATIVGTDETTDLALIKVDGVNDLHAIPMGDSDSLKVGEWVLAVGNPFGFTSSVTAGIVSAKARNISALTGVSAHGGIESYIQTDAAVNAGNSGGALVNLRGELVGINAAIYSNTGTYAGCSFAIPTAIVRKVTDDLRQYGAVQRAFLNITFRELTPELIEEQNIRGVNRGIYVEEVQDRSAAREAGIRHGDVIIAINGVEVTGTASIQEIMARLSPGNTVTMVYVRDGKRNECSVTLRNRDGNTNLTAANASTFNELMGADFAAAGEELLNQLELSRGVQVSITGNGRFSDAGVRDGFVITAINNVRVSAPEDIVKIYKAVRSSGAADEQVLFISGIYPSGKRAHYAVDIAE